MMQMAHGHIDPSASLFSRCLRCEWCTQATTYVNNLLVGARNIDHRGQFHVINLGTNDTFQCSIKEPFFGKSRHEVCVLAASGRMHMPGILIPFLEAVAIFTGGQLLLADLEACLSSSVSAIDP